MKQCIRPSFMAPEFSGRRECRFYTDSVIIKWRQPGLPRSELGRQAMPGSCVVFMLHIKYPLSIIMTNFVLQKSRFFIPGCPKI